MLKKLKQVIYTKFVEINLPFIPKYLSKYDSLFEDLKSLFYYYVLRKRNQKYDLNFESLEIFPTTACNANCTFCANRYLKDKRQVMSFEIFKKVVDEFVALGGKSLGLTPSPGEVFVDSGFFEKLKYLDKKDLEYSFYTNGILLRENAENILSSGLKIIYIDIADVDPSYDAKVFGISEILSKKRLEGIFYFLKEVEKRKSSIKVELCFRPSRYPKKIFRELMKSQLGHYYSKGLFSVSFLQSYDNWGGAIKKKDLMGNQTLKLPCKIKEYPCKSFFGISVLPNGDIRLCGCRFLKTLEDELVIGNIKKDSLKDLKKSKKWRKIIEDFQKGKSPEVCKDCSFYRPKIGGNYD